MSKYHKIGPIFFRISWIQTQTKEGVYFEIENDLFFRTFYEHILVLWIFGDHGTILEPFQLFHLFQQIMYLQHIPLPLQLIKPFQQIEPIISNYTHYDQ